MKKTNTKALAKKYSLDDAKRILLDIFQESSDSENIIRDIADNILPKILSGTKKESDEAKRTLLAKSDEAIMLMGLTTHYPLLDMVDRRYAALLLSLTQQIEKDFNCSTAVEKTLAEDIAVAHIKVIDQSRRLNDWLNYSENSDGVIKASHLEALSRQIDRANRQLLSSFSVLRQIKHPQLEINIRNAFIAQNQQINSIQSKS